MGLSFHPKGQWLPMPVPLLLPPSLWRGKNKWFLVPKEEVAVLMFPAPPGMLLEEKPLGVFRSQLLCFITFLGPLQIFEQLVDGRDGCLLLSRSGEKKGNASSLGTTKASDAFCGVAVYATPSLRRDPSQFFLRMFNGGSVDAGVNTQRSNQFSLGALLSGTSQ